MKPLSRLAPAVLAAGAILAVLVPDPARADAVDDAVKSFEDYLATNPDSQGLRNQIAELGLKKDPRVAKAMLPLLKGRKYDDDVKIAVAQSIGKQGDKTVVVTLKTMADAKDIEKEKPKLLAALLEGIGDVDAKANYKFLLDIGKKQLDYSADIAGAAFRAASNYVANDTVDDMLKELTRADYVTTKDNPVKAAARNGTKPVLIDILKKMTGQDIGDRKIWDEWWDKNKKTWKPAAAGESTEPDLAKIDLYVDPVYGFEVKRPNKAWSMRRNKGGQHYMTLEAMDEGQKAASCEMYVFGTSNYKEKKPDLMAQNWRDNNEPKFRDLKEAVWDKKCTYGGAKGIEMILVGQHKDEGAVQMHNVFVEQGEVMYYWICTWRSGKPASMKDDIEEVLKSFKIKR